MQVALVGYCLAGPFIGLTGSLPALFVALFAWGAFQGTLDVAMNTQAIAVERSGRRVLMSGLHGSWSIGAFAGAAIGALAVGRRRQPERATARPRHAALLAVGLLTARLLPDAVERGRATPTGSTPAAARSRRRRRGGQAEWPCSAPWRSPSMLCEGAAADWASVYLSGPLHTTGVVTGLGYVAFSLAMVTVRLSGNRLLTRFRADRLLPALAAVATVGFAAGLVIATPVAALFGFACLGIGLASVVPSVFSAAGRIPGLHPGTAVATVSACGWAGFVCGAPLVAQLSSVASLPVALGLIPVLTAFLVAGTLSARALRTRPSQPGPEQVAAR